jgi:SpoVK/Ycf46/Vps4 family AAA+-type ATPase
VIAAELELDLYTVDISQMVSKYIGETEKNLDRVFTAARDSNAVLFFDEADAIFGKRSPVRDAHDRYANIEVGYLLQKMEQHDGIVILGTNLRTNMDDAFIRRLHHAVEFPFPDELLRLPIWHKHLAPGIPRDDDIDLAFLARQFEVAGGNIRNIVVNGCFLAAADDAPLAMRHLILATRREFQKMGRVCDEETFGPYFALIAGPANDGGAA